MPTDFILPTSIELRQIAQDKLPTLTADRVGFSLFPFRDEDNWLISWEQRDNYLGLMQVRGLNGAPSKVRRIGAKRYQMEAGVYGEFIDLDELELTTRRQWGTFGTPIDVQDLVTQSQDYLLQRYLDRVETIIWTLIVTGTFSVVGPSGATVHTDAFTTQTFSASPSWATVATATPFADLRAVQLLGRGHSVNMGSGATAYLNRKTSNYLLSNTNQNDIAGRRTGGFGTFNTIAEINTLSLGDDLPQFRIYDDGYLRESDGVFVPYIPDNKVVVIGQRPAGQTLGEVLQVRNVNNAGMGPGPYSAVIDHGEDFIPRNIEVHYGANFGPAIYYPSAIVVMSV
jgi:hypothetical protein